MAAEFNLGKGKYKHRIADDDGFKGHKIRPTGFSLDEQTITRIAEMALLNRCNKSALIRRLVANAYGEMVNG
jgi:hypothetical protein